MRVKSHKGRGAFGNATSRFDSLRREAFDDGWREYWDGDEDPAQRTTILDDNSRSIISINRSPDIAFDRSINPYRGCEHGCIYCYARPTHAWLGLSPGLDFETRIFAKKDAAGLLATELGKPGYRPSVMALGANTDPYQPIECRLNITRGVLEVLRDFRHPVTVVTKSALIERDIDILASMAALRLSSVAVSVTTLDPDLNRRMEPRAAAPQRRMQTIRRLTEAGIPVGVLVAPIIPALTDSELEKIVTACASAGAVTASYVLLRLPLEVQDLFGEWLREHYPLKAEHVFGVLRDMHDGKLYEAAFGTRMRGTGPFAAVIRQRFRMVLKRRGLGTEWPDLDCSAFSPPARTGDQFALF